MIDTERMKEEIEKDRDTIVTKHVHSERFI